MRAGRLCKTEEISPWDWRHRIGFDASLRGRILEIANSRCISRQEKQIINELIEYFTDYISVDCLINTITEGDYAALAEIRFLEKTKILSVPSICQGIILRKYNQLERALKEEAHPIMDMIGAAFDTQHIARPMEAMGIVFGDMLEDIIDYGKEESKIAPINVNQQKSILPDDAQSILKEYEKQLRSGLTKDLPTHESSVKQSFTLKTTKGAGFAEYWPWFLTEKADTNELILYENEDSLREDQFYPTLNHELFPGHAYFYQLMERARPRFVDHGAYALVEGWATWAEWNGLKPEYASHSRAFRLRSLSLLDCESACNAIDIYTFMKHEGYGEENATEACLQFFQYPSLGASYTLGAIWFEQYLSGKKPLDFFEELSRCDRGWGDFFRIW